MSNVVLTFDDGYASHWMTVRPILLQYEFNATFFINGMFLRRSDTMSAHEVSQLHSEGFEIGNHFNAHSNFTKHDKHYVLNDLYKMREILEQMNISCSSVAYPGFHCDDDVCSYMEETTYSAGRAGCERNINSYACGGSGRYYNSKTDNKFEIPCAGVFGKNYFFEDFVEDLNRSEDGIPIFCFHDVGGSGDVDISCDEFERCIDFLHKEKYNTIKMNEIGKI
jgi:hypothetical protein